MGTCGVLQIAAGAVAICGALATSCNEKRFLSILVLWKFVLEYSLYYLYLKINLKILMTY